MERTNPWWLRLIFLIVALQALLLIIVFFQPENVKLLVPWPATPLNARFIAALYVALGFGVLLCCWAQRFREVRIVLTGIGVVTAALLLLTIPWFGILDPFPTFWTLFYIVDPILVAFAFWRLRGTYPAPAGSSPLAPLWIVHALVYGIIGAVLLLAPSLAVSLWPWALTEPLSRMYSMFFLILALTFGLSAREPRWEGVRILTFSVTLLAVLVLAVSVYHLDRFKPGIYSIGWFALFGVEVLLLGALLVRHLARPAVKEVVA